MSAKYVRVSFLAHRGMSAHENTYWDSRVLPVPNLMLAVEHNLKAPGRAVLEYREYLTTHGFQMVNEYTREGVQSTFYDTEEWVTPAAIMRVVECDERGYTAHDRQEIKKRRSSR